MVAPLIPLVARAAVGVGAVALGRKALGATPGAASAPPGRRYNRRAPSGGGRRRPGRPSPHSDETVHVEREDLTNRLFGVQVGWDLFDKAASKARGNLPTFTHSITVTCVGGPLADLRRTYYLALATAFGRWSNGVAGELSGSYKALHAHVDVTGKSVVVNLSYSTLAAVQAVKSVAGAEDVPLQIIQRGPDQVTIGGQWPSFLQLTTKGSSTIKTGIVGSVLGGLAFGLPGAIVGGIVGVAAANSGSSATATGSAVLVKRSPALIPGCPARGYSPVVLIEDGKAPSVYAELPYPLDNNEGWRIPFGQLTAGGPSGSMIRSTGALTSVPLPDAGRVITTGEKRHPLVQPPKPPLDGATRSSLVALVSQALSSPCYLPAPVPCNPRNPLFTSGLAAAPGVLGQLTGLVYEQFVQGASGATNQGEGAVPPTAPVGVDGYAPIPTNVPNVYGR